MILHLEIPDALLDDYEIEFGQAAVPIHNIEEAAEYIHAITRYQRGKTIRVDEIVEEAADLLICLMHLIRMLDQESELVVEFGVKQGKALRAINEKGKSQ